MRQISLTAYLQELLATSTVLTPLIVWPLLFCLSMNICYDCIYS